MSVIETGHTTALDHVADAFDTGTRATALPCGFTPKIRIAALPRGAMFRGGAIDAAAQRRRAVTKETVGVRLAAQAIVDTAILAGVTDRVGATVEIRATAGPREQLAGWPGPCAVFIREALHTAQRPRITATVGALLVGPALCATECLVQTLCAHTHRAISVPRASRGAEAASLVTELARGAVVVGGAGAGGSVIEDTGIRHGFVGRGGLVAAKEVHNQRKGQQRFPHGRRVAEAHRPVNRSPRSPFTRAQ